MPKDKNSSKKPKEFTQQQASDMYDALKYYQQGINHFYKCINFKKSALDAEAIQFMNDSSIAIDKAIANAEK